jgi:ribosome-associated protein
MAIEAAKAASDKKANDCLILEMGELFYLTDYFVICSGNNDRQVSRIHKEVEDRLRAQGAKPYRREGERFNRWVLLDYVDIVVHIFLQEEREYYDIERLWKDAPRVEWEEEREPAVSAS